MLLRIIFDRRQVSDAKNKQKLLLACTVYTVLSQNWLRRNLRVLGKVYFGKSPLDSIFYNFQLLCRLWNI